MNYTKRILFLFILTGVFACKNENKEDNKSPQEVNKITEKLESNPEMNLYWGDTHLHTNFSSDAFLFGTVIATPEDAYRFAKGEVLTHPVTKEKVQINDPLDFLVVSDHAEGLGSMYKAKLSDSLLMTYPQGKNLQKLVNAENPLAVFLGWMKKKNQGKATLTEIDTNAVMKSTWKQYTSFADKHNNPGKFTAFIGWEWTSTPGGKNLHRVVFTPDNQDKAVQYLPFSATHSDAPEDLWNWLENTSSTLGAKFTAIPHNSNISGGLMFPEERTYKGNPVDKAYSSMRAKWESVAEITQIKGTSETAPVLSPNDEFADFELWDVLLNAESGSIKRGKPGKGDFVRDALKTGLLLEGKTGVNPYKFGLIGSSDAHTAMPAVEENNFQGKFHVDGAQPEKNKAVILSIKALEFSSSGYAAVWAENNSREAIFNAFKRKEVYASTGPRIALRLFGGYNFNKEDVNAANYVNVGYKKGVPMGGELLVEPNKKPQLLIHASKDPKGANLDRIQVVKGWLENGEVKEKVYDVAWAGDRKLNANGKLAPVGNTVDVNSATYENNIGDASLHTLWQDPDFNPDYKTFYYVRVLEIPTPRYSTYASAMLKKAPWEIADATIQERAYSSPIWYTPN